MKRKIFSGGNLTLWSQKILELPCPTYSHFEPVESDNSTMIEIYQHVDPAADDPVISAETQIYYSHKIDV